MTMADIDDPPFLAAVAVGFYAAGREARHFAAKDGVIYLNALAEDAAEAGIQLESATFEQKFFVTWRRDQIDATTAEWLGREMFAKAMEKAGGRAVYVDFARADFRTAKDPFGGEVYPTVTIAVSAFVQADDHKAGEVDDQRQNHRNAG
jgi:hypothetical protein